MPCLPLQPSHSAEEESVECAICGIKGEIKVENGHIAVKFSEEEQKKSRLTVAGKLEHFLEVRENLRIAMARKDLGEIPERLKKYEGYGEIKKELAAKGGSSETRDSGN